MQYTNGQFICDCGEPLTEIDTLEEAIYLSQSSGRQFVVATCPHCEIDICFDVTFNITNIQCNECDRKPMEGDSNE